MLRSVFSNCGAGFGVRQLAAAFKSASKLAHSKALRADTTRKPLSTEGIPMKTNFSICAVILFAGYLCAQEPATLKTEKDKVNYGIGVGVARNFQRQGLEVDLDLVIRGLRDALAGTKLLMTEEELQTTMTAFQADLQKKVQEATKAAAEKNKQEGEAFLAENSKKDGVVTLPSGLQYKILKAGDGKKPSSQDSVECHYRGTFINGAEFDSSYKRGQPLSLKVDGGVIAGWSEALKLMPVGSKWQVFIPSKLAYGATGAGSQIGPNSTLIFEVELLAIK
jgi:UDP-GlcNAc:undecaprenyl-phosphate/decaprenyl-phosphate GlcNAc-1-phosphate transferase